MCLETFVSADERTRAYCVLLRDEPNRYVVGGVVFDQAKQARLLNDP